MSDFAARATEAINAAASAVGLSSSNSNSSDTKKNSGDSSSGGNGSSNNNNTHNSFNAVPGDASEREHGKDPNPDVKPTQGSAKAPEFLADLGGTTQAGLAERPTQPQGEQGSSQSNQ